MINGGPYGPEIMDLVLVNEGFHNNFEQKPQLPSFNMSNPQASPDLKERATLAAYKFGYLLSDILQLTPSNGSIGMSYDLLGQGPGYNLWRSFGAALSMNRGLSLGNLAFNQGRAFLFSDGFSDARKYLQCNFTFLFLEYL
jgi:hypothetical protein